jgi:hypothetical protein
MSLNPDVLPIFVTTTPQWLLDKYIQGRYLYRPRRLDVGVIQSDGLTMDLEATLSACQEMKDRSEALIRAEADFIVTNQVRLVYADIPPLAVAIAQAAGIPCWMEGNFGWNFIYRPYGEAFQPIVEWIDSLYGHCDRLFQLPFHEPMSVFPVRESVGLTGGNPSIGADAIRERLKLDPNRPVVLLTFGGFGIQNFPYQALTRFSEWQFLCFDDQAPDLPHLIRLDKSWRPVDLMPVCERVVSKPGYGTLSEALRTGTGFTCVTREGFAESDLLITGLRRYGRHQIISQAAFFQEPWNFLKEPLLDPSESNPLDPNGNETIAQRIQDFLVGR